MKLMNILMMVQGLRQMTTTLPNQLDLICLYKGKELEKLQKILTRLTANKIKMIHKDNTQSLNKKFNILNLIEYQKIKIEILMT